MAVFLEYLSVINGIIYVRGFQIILICDNYTIRMVVNVRILGDILVNRNNVVLGCSQGVFLNYRLLVL